MNRARKVILTRSTIAAHFAAGLAASAAHAEIVYTLPPQPITAAIQLPDTHASAPIDINNDGVAEFTIHAHHQHSPPFSMMGTYIQAERPGAGIRILPDEGFAPLPEGTLISNADSFLTDGLEFWWEVGLGGWAPWQTDAPAFLGFVIDIDGQSHYGWARAQLLFNDPPSPTAFGVSVLDYAYQTEPGVPILAGQVPAPGAAALLGLGAIALRRKRS
ncbi:MAG: hypothetical protein KF869_00660 [Phycisphaeraceae bacterium]|nr:hypothetical protein [Phycisphaeraceae bacterium]